MSEMNFIVDENKCIHCGLCVSDCSAEAIQMNDSNVPVVAKNGERRCFKCQHCLAICPVGAISVIGKNPDEAQPTDNYPESEKLLNLIESRRSFRQYKNESTPEELMAKLKNMLNYVPTGCNVRGLHFTFVEDTEVMEDIRETVKQKLKKIFSSFPKFLLGRFAGYKRDVMAQKDLVFRDAPNMVIVSVQKDAPCADIDPVIALSYFELYAQSLGLGTCWCGLGKMIFKSFPDIAKKLNIPDDYKLSYVMLFGPSKIKYPRTIVPDEYGKNTVNKI